MKVFIMWSGARSKTIAEHLYEFLRAVIQRPAYFISTEDIPSGSVWESIIAGELETTHFGIACLTSDNLQSTWIHFEAGAISKVSANAVVVPYLAGVDSSDVTGPLTKYQATLANKQGTRALASSLNSAQPESERTDAAAVETVFESLWPNLQKVIARTATSPAEEPAQTRPQEEILREILNRLRNLEREARPGLRNVQPRMTPSPLDLTRTLGYALEGKRILWVDDHPDNNDLPRNVLEGAGADVDLAKSTEEALSALQKQPGRTYDLVITDMRRGDNMSAGLDLLSVMRESGLRIPSIVHSTNPLARQKETVLQDLGAVAVSVGHQNLIENVLRMFI